MKILVLGGAGYIGSIAASRLADAGHSPLVLDDLSAGCREAVKEGIPFYEGDMGDMDLLDSIFKAQKVELVMHFAAKISVEESIRHPDIYYRNNVTKTITILDAMVKHDCLMMVYSSSAAVYGRPEYLPVDEKHATNPINPYGSSKKMVETILKDYQRAFGLKSLVFRYFNAAGAALDGSMGESRKVKQNLIPIILEKLEQNGEVCVFGGDWDTEDGTCVRDYIHVEDIVSAHVRAVDYLLEKDESNTFNLGSEQGASVKEVIKTITKVSNREVKHFIGDRRPGDPAKLVASSRKATELLGWRPVNSELELVIRSAYLWNLNRRY